MTKPARLGMLPAVAGRRSFSRWFSFRRANPPSFSPSSEAGSSAHGTARAPFAGSVRLGLALSLVAALVGCTSGTETGNPSLTGSLSYTGYSSDPEAFGVGQQGLVARVDSAWFALDRVSTLSCGADEGFEVSALGVGDHAAGNHNVTPFEAMAGEFCRMRLPFLEVSDDAMLAGAPASLAGHALLLTGSLADGTPFTIVSDSRPVVELDAVDGGFELASGQTDLLLAFDFASWLGGIDFSAAVRNSSDEIVISGEENADLLGEFDARLSSGVSLYRDRDGDGAVDREPQLLAAPR